MSKSVRLTAAALFAGAAGLLPLHLAAQAAPAPQAAGASEQALIAKARGIHDRAIKADTHNDINVSNFTDACNYTMRLTNQVNLPKMTDGDMDVSFMIVYTGQGPRTAEGYASAYTRASGMFDAIHYFTEKIAPTKIGLALTPADVLRLHKEGKRIAVIGVENGYPIGNDIKKVEEFYKRGGRYMSLAHNGNSQLADSNTGEAQGYLYNNGLSPLGREVIAEMNRLGMMVDLSHPSKGANLEAIKLSKAPVIASHSSARALAQVPRNMNDRMIRELAAHGGTMQVNYNTGFLSQAFADARAANDGAIRNAIDAEATELCGNNMACEIQAGSDLARERVERGTLPKVEWTEIVDHIDHAAKLAGAEHVGLGSDFDGADMPYGMEDVTGLPKLTQALLERGYTPDQVRDILGRNLLRVMEQVEKVAAEEQRARR